MKILIIGLGYAGMRFQRAFAHVGAHLGIELSIAYVDHRPRQTPLRYFAQVGDALQEHRPDIVVVSTNDISHAVVLEELAGYPGFVLCEKPLVTPSDSLERIEPGLRAAGRAGTGVRGW